MKLNENDNKVKSNKRVKDDGTLLWMWMWVELEVEWSVCGVEKGMNNGWQCL